MNRFLIISISISMLTITAGPLGGSSEKNLEEERATASTDISMCDQRQHDHATHNDSNLRSVVSTSKGPEVASAQTTQECDGRRLTNEECDELHRRLLLLTGLKSRGIIKEISGDHFRFWPSDY